MAGIDLVVLVNFEITIMILHGKHRFLHSFVDIDVELRRLDDNLLHHLTCLKQDSLL